MNDITKPLSVAIGSHAAGTGVGCAMNVVSWANGDAEITDFPSCSDHLIASFVQHINDNICRCIPEEPGGRVLGIIGQPLCPEHASLVIELGFATVGSVDWFATDPYHYRQSIYGFLCDVVVDSGWFTEDDFLEYMNTGDAQLASETLWLIHRQSEGLAIDLAGGAFDAIYESYGEALGALCAGKSSAVLESLARKLTEKLDTLRSRKNAEPVSDEAKAEAYQKMTAAAAV